MSTSEYRARDHVSLTGGQASRLPTIDELKRIPADVWIVGALTVFAAVIRFATIATQSYWTDEALTAYEAHLPFGAMINTVAHVETTPPLYFVVAWVWAKVFGTGEAALRSVSALAGTAFVPLTYLAARDLISRRAGAIAAAFAAVNPFLIWYSQEARSYMLLAALSAGSFLWFVRAVRDPSRRPLIWWACFSALALMTHFFAGFLVAPEAVWLLWVARSRIVAIAVGAVALVQLAMLPFALVDTTHGAGWIHAIPLKNRIAQVPLEFSLASIYRRATTAEGLIGGAVLLAIVVALIALAEDARIKRGAKLAGGIAAAVFLVPLLLGLVGPDYFLARNLIPMWVPLAIVLAAACVVPRSRLAGAALAVVSVAAFGFAAVHIQSSAYLQRPQWRDVARAIGEAPIPRAVLAAGGATANPLKIYLPHVSWVQPRRRVVQIDELVVVGTRSRLTLASQGPSSTGAHAATGKATTAPTTVGVALPRLGTPPGTVPLSRSTVRDWVVARFKLDHPWRVDLNQLTARSSTFFHHAPEWVLAFFQQPGR